MSTISPTSMILRAKDWVGHMVDKKVALNFPYFQQMKMKNWIIQKNISFFYNKYI
jgi:hypothetical protein